MQNIFLQKLFVLSGANMQSTADQTFTKVGTFTNYIITHVVARRASGGTTIACAGGIYSAASKAGNAWVAAAQSWINLTGAGKVVNATRAAVADTDQASTTPVLSLTTGSTAAATADFVIYGIPLD